MWKSLGIKMRVWRLVILFSVKTISHLVSHLQTKQHETRKSKYNGHDDNVCLISDSKNTPTGQQKPTPQMSLPTEN